jgi:hypothetical protein
MRLFAQQIEGQKNAKTQENQRKQKQFKDIFRFLNSQLRF